VWSVNGQGPDGVSALFGSAFMGCIY
jgi:hypothetical protein